MQHKQNLSFFTKSYFFYHHQITKKHSSKTIYLHKQKDYKKTFICVIIKNQ